MKKLRYGTLLLLTAVMFVLPIYLSERFLVPAFSSQAKQIRVANHALAHGEGRHLLLLGDSTVRNLQLHERDFDSDPDVVNLAAGGSMVKEWYYSMRNAFRENTSLKSVVVGMSNGEMFETAQNIAPYFPFLLGPADVWDEYRGGRLSFDRSLALFFEIFVRLQNTKDDVLYSLVSGLVPRTGPFMQRLSMEQVRLSGGRTSAGGVGAFDGADWGVRAIVSLAKERGVPVTFVLSPVSSAARRNELYPHRRERFYFYCRRYELNCADFSEKVPDQYFSNDGVHIQSPFPHFRALISGVLEKDVSL